MFLDDGRISELGLGRQGVESVNVEAWRISNMFIQLWGRICPKAAFLSEKTLNNLGCLFLRLAVLQRGFSPKECDGKFVLLNGHPPCCKFFSLMYIHSELDVHTILYKEARTCPPSPHNINAKH